MNKQHSRFNRRTPKSFDRKNEIRDERVPSKDLTKIVISFKDYISNVPKGNEQNFSKWEDKKFLSVFLQKLCNITELTINEAKQQGIIKEYLNFPERSKFECPKKLIDARWSVINKVTGQKARVAGHIVDNIFYVVFLDKDHDFWPSKMKNT